MARRKKLVVTRGTELSPAGLPEAFKDAPELGFRQNRAQKWPFVSKLTGRLRT